MEQGQFVRMDDLLLARRQNRKQALKRMARAAKHLYNLGMSQVPKETSNELAIQLKDLLINHDEETDLQSQFFRPRPTAWAASHPVDLNDELVGPSVRRWERFWSSHDEDQSIITEQDGAGVLASYLAIEFGQHSRLPEDSGSLETLSGWEEGDLDSTILKSRFMTPRVFAAGEETNNLAAWATEVDSVWYREEENPDDMATPHIMALLIHHHPAGPEADLLLRTELLIALGIMQTRLGIYKEHEVAPVVLISCFNGSKARIVQTQFSNNEMVVHRGRIYDFTSPQARSDSVPLFMAYMSSQPIGTTRHLQPVEEEEGDK
ncbi:hypothetical protein BJY00DRAFT_312652 [Aspergillus carlsbadensis]|nr:hypothetical protein BJY00DRAFT_312652 [Aspergillus carlsbadensis]